MNHCVDAKVIDELPSGLAFWNIANSASEWTQGGHEVNPPSPCSKEIGKEKEEVKEKKAQKKTFMQNTLIQCLLHVDPSFSSYSRPLLQTLEEAMKDKLREIITNGHIAKLLGPKRCRLILSYLATMMMHECIPFFELWSFLLQRPIEANGRLIRWNVLEDSEDAIAIQYKK
jgi:hypothetical protein